MLGIVLAGGESKRFGEDKARFSFTDGPPQLERALRLLERFCSEIAISGRESQRTDRRSLSDAEYLPDLEGIAGPISGILAGLTRARGKPLLAVACDMPFIDAEILSELLKHRDADRLATCFLSTDDRPEPMCAIYEPASLEALSKRAKDRRLGLRTFLEGPGISRITCSRPEALASVNTKGDLELHRKRLS